MPRAKPQNPKQGRKGGVHYKEEREQGNTPSQRGQAGKQTQRQPKLTPRQQKNLERQTRLKMRKDRQRCAYGDAQWKDDFTKFLAQLKVIGLTIKDVAGDGNCLFRAMADQLEGDPSLHFTYRSNICDYISESREDFEPFVEDDEPFDAYIKRMRTASTWGGQMEIQAFSLLYKVNITIHQLDSPRWDILNFPVGEVKTIHLSYHDGQHYCSVRSLNDPNINKRGVPRKIEMESPKTAVKNTAQKGKDGQNSQKTKSTPQTPKAATASVASRAITPEEREVMEITGCTNREFVRNLLIDNWGDSSAVIEFILMMGPDAKHYEEEYMMEKIMEKQIKEVEALHAAEQAEIERAQTESQLSQFAYDGNFGGDYGDFGGDFPEYKDFQEYEYKYDGAVSAEDPANHRIANKEAKLQEKTINTEEKPKKNYQKQKPKPEQDPEVPFVHPKLAKFANQNLSNKERKEMVKQNREEPSTAHVPNKTQALQEEGDGEADTILRDLGSMQI